MLLKIDDVCHILDLPEEFYPMDMAVNFLQTGSEKNTVKLEDQSFAGKTLIRRGNVSLDHLHPDIQRLCTGHEVVKSEQVSVPVQHNQEFELTLSNSTVVPSTVSTRTQCCSLQVTTKQNYTPWLPGIGTELANPSSPNLD